MKTVSENKAFGGVQGVYSHASDACKCDMTFGLFLPEEAQSGPVPVLWYLSGLTCTHENAMTKAGAQTWAAEQGIALVFPDTSPRGEGVADDDAYDLGQGAGFYVNATQSPWAPHFSMWDYVADELPALLGDQFAVDLDRQAITGHSMGGHGALTLAMNLPGRFRSVSAFAPICNPVNCPWGQKAFENYLGEDRSLWQTYDASYVAATTEVKPANTILVDQGLADQFLEQELHPYALETACESSSVPLKLRRHLGYDHGYYFIATYIEDHLRHHAAALTG